MRTPVTKQLPPSIPILSEAVQAHLMSFDGRVYSEKRPCPECGSENAIRKGFTTRIYCRLITEEGFVDVTVRIQRFQCGDCGAKYNAEGPFYDGCGYGAPVVDLCLALAANMPPNRGEALLTELGVQVDRDTIRNYHILFWRRAERYAGLSFMGVNLAVNVLKILTGAENVEQLREMLPEEWLRRKLPETEKRNVITAGVADETYPTKKGAKRRLEEENRRRKREGKKPKTRPEGFTVATTYLPRLNIFTSVCVQDVNFNFLLADTLMRPLKGADYCVVDGSDAYSGTHPNLKRCTIHLRRSTAKRDPKLQELRKSDFEAFLKEYRSIHDRLKEEFIAELEAELGEALPDDVPTSTNSMEGGNWRLKYALATPYWTLEGIRGRILSVCIRDSLKTFSGGRPVWNPVVELKHFSYGLIMAA